jgi:hypothetical protein
MNHLLEPSSEPQSRCRATNSQGPAVAQTKTKRLEPHYHRTTRDRAANLRLYRLVAEVLGAIEAGAFHADRRVAVQGACVSAQVLGVGVGRNEVQAGDT